MVDLFSALREKYHLYYAECASTLRTAMTLKIVWSCLC